MIPRVKSLALISRSAHARCFRGAVTHTTMMYHLVVLVSILVLASASNVRLVDIDGNYNTRIGRVEVFVDNHWGQVCGDGFASVDAGVVCKSLGYNDKGGVETGNHGIGNTSIVIGRVACNGQEATILDCQYT